ncbi:Protein DENND6B [Psilocybe cubensis]|uniref:Protein DENND6B n=2 Tax=Psilocybe cubensis TaxID=181762 RepID=A0ACB8H236_PSICU|nr:Protein DENND6B [Psilocybe cubensis]KAH9481785.1 Protein DENND6B [Psilocybe cubensis]
MPPNRSPPTAAPTPSASASGSSTQPPAPPPLPLHLDPPEQEEDIGDLSPYIGFPSSSTTASTASLSSAGSVSTAGSARWKGGLGGSRETETHGRGFGYGYGYSVFGDEDGDGEEAEGYVPGDGETQTPRRATFVPPKTTTTVMKEQHSQHSQKPVQHNPSTSTPPPPPRHDEQRHPRKMHTELQALSLDVDSAAVVKMRRWILGIAIVEFDLDTGPVVDGVYPPLALLPAEAENIAFCALPDSLQFDQGSQTHSFRVRAQARNKPEDTTNPDSYPPTTLDGFIYGFSHFVQRRDASAKRGYHQRAVVILTQHAYPALFTVLVALFGPLFEKHGTPMLEAACHNIATWPPPLPGTTPELGFLGTVLPVEIPHSQDAQQVAETSSFGESPAETSQAVWWLRDLVRPIPLAGDIRPYFTMQDADHSQLVNRLPPKPGLLLGVTNPFFERSCAHWPHVLSLGRERSTSSTSPKQKSPTLGAPAGPPPGWTTKTHKRYISKDRALLKKLEGVFKRGGGGNGGGMVVGERERIEASLMLRKHFCTRSMQLITPLARYLNTLIPSPDEVHGHRAAVAAGHAHTRTQQNPASKQPQTWSAGSGLRYLASTASLPAPARGGTSSQSQSPSPSLSSTPSPANSTGSSPVPSFRSVNLTSMSSSSTSTTLNAATANARAGISASTSSASTSASGSGSGANANGNALKAAPTPLLRLKPFNSAAFLASLKTYGGGVGGLGSGMVGKSGGAGGALGGVGSLLPFKSASKRIEFYERWLKSPAFATWLAQQEQIVLNVLNEPAPSGTTSIPGSSRAPKANSSQP